MTEDERIEYAVGVLDRLSGAIYPQRRPVRIGDWHPAPHYCHDNVRRWISVKPEHKHVLGFVVFDFSYFGYVELIPHSLVEIEDGTLVDITPHGAEDEAPFVPHLGPMEDFVAMAEHSKVRVPVIVLRKLRGERALKARQERFLTTKS